MLVVTLYHTLEVYSVGCHGLLNEFCLFDLPLRVFFLPDLLCFSSTVVHFPTWLGSQIAASSETFDKD